MRKVLAALLLLTSISFNANAEYIAVADTDYCLQLANDFQRFENLKMALTIPEIEPILEQYFQGFDASEEVSNMVVELLTLYQAELFGSRMWPLTFSHCVMSGW